ncbi:uncharacterized protein LOC142559808 isoform X1 [Dermacentor variabilis]|uniref:uncharacterized protein LOC142559808 isoform X1 n=1 Tax=Dermacentor variabilis TaxID=34621 RepID=UPI003F5CA447
MCAQRQIPYWMEDNVEERPAREHAAQEKKNENASNQKKTQSFQGPIRKRKIDESSRKARCAGRRESSRKRRQEKVGYRTGSSRPTGRLRTRATRTSPNWDLLPTRSWASPLYPIVNGFSKPASFCAHEQNESSRAMGPEFYAQLPGQNAITICRRLPSLFKPEPPHSGRLFIHQSHRHCVCAKFLASVQNLPKLPAGLNRNFPVHHK